MPSKRTPAHFYTRGKFGKRLREVADQENPYLYSQGRYATKLQPSDLPNTYISIHSRSLWYTEGFIQTANVVDICYIPLHLNHLFKDDYLYISYSADRPLQIEPTRYGIPECLSYDICICGNDIPKLLEAIALNSPHCHNLSETKASVKEKVEWFATRYPESSKSINYLHEHYDWL